MCRLPCAQQPCARPGRPLQPRRRLLTEPSNWAPRRGQSRLLLYQTRWHGIREPPPLRNTGPARRRHRKARSREDLTPLQVEAHAFKFSLTFPYPLGPHIRPGQLSVLDTRTDRRVQGRLSYAQKQEDIIKTETLWCLSLLSK